MILIKALSIHPDFALSIFTGGKTVECRTWKTDYRGDLLICSTRKKVKGTIPGHALCVVKLADIQPFRRKHLKAAQMSSTDYQPGLYAWILEDVRTIIPFEVKGKLSLWECDHPIQYVDDSPDSMSEEEGDKLFKEIWEPLFV